MISDKALLRIADALERIAICLENKKKPTPVERPLNARSKFLPPSLQEVADYCQSRNNKIDPEVFIDHYEANGWMRGKNKIKCWKSCVRTWEKSPRRHETPKRKIGELANERLQQALKGSGDQGNSNDWQHVPKLTTGEEAG